MVEGKRNGRPAVYDLIITKEGTVSDKTAGYALCTYRTTTRSGSSDRDYRAVYVRAVVGASVERSYARPEATARRPIDEEAVITSRLRRKVD